MKILLAVDGSACSLAAVDEVSRRPWPAGSVVKILSVSEPPFAPTPETWSLPESYYSQIEAAAKERANAAVGAALERLRPGDAARLEITTEIKDGLTKDVIIREAERWGADLVVLGSHGYNGWRRFLLGSVSHAVASHAPCSVEIVRCREPGKEGG